MSARNLWVWFGVGALILGAGCGSEKKKGCHKDTDCKGERICEKHRCVDPPENVEPSGSNDAKDKVDAGSPSASLGGSSSTSPPRLQPTPTPSLPGAPGASSGLFGGLIKLKICQNGKCKSLDQVLKGDPTALFKLFGSMGLQGQRGRAVGPKLKICSGGHCIDVDKDFGKRPGDLMKMFGMISGLMFRGPGGGGAGPFGGRGVAKRPRLAPKGWGVHPSNPPSVKKKDPPHKVSFRSMSAIIKAGDGALGRVAELKNLQITVVRNTQVVLKGTGRLLVVLDIPPKLQNLVSKLQTQTNKVTVSFYVTQSPLPNLVRGEIIGLR